MFRLFPQLEEHADIRAGVLSGSEQQMLTICRTLISDPDLVMIDEPTEGLSSMMVRVSACSKSSPDAGSRFC
jgi:branched-chain amino acid transport system ATP-binding protein